MPGKKNRVATYATLSYSSVVNALLRTQDVTAELLFARLAALLEALAPEPQVGHVGPLLLDLEIDRVLQRNAATRANQPDVEPIRMPCCEAPLVLTGLRAIRHEDPVLVFVITVARLDDEAASLVRVQKRPVDAERLRTRARFQIKLDLVTSVHRRPQLGLQTWRRRRVELDLRVVSREVPGRLGEHGRTEQQAQNRYDEFPHLFPLEKSHKS